MFFINQQNRGKFNLTEQKKNNINTKNPRKIEGYNFIYDNLTINKQLKPTLFMII